MAFSCPADVEHATRRLPILSGVEVVREGRVEPFLHAHPTLSGSTVHWAGLALRITRFRHVSYRDMSTLRTSSTSFFMVRSSTRS
jgi:hypothetical protein